MPAKIRNDKCRCAKLGTCCAYCYKARIADGQGCVTRATIADRDLTDDYLTEHREARMGGWE